ncbi:unnamed protein product [Phyllotreta striolata]|uniref:Elongation factor Ts, mitochondrial n=1 Tax=Phyllotreta striolata TaxID=444603 RepID=A0A9N9TQW0_PHYSR|nr:unnamed protein product [Phyllotreta striolata]
MLFLSLCNTSVVILLIFVMQIIVRSVRHFCLTHANFGTEKSLLATLRKRTGYTFANCKKALEIHNNDLIKAENWLKQQAQAMGWSKATKLEGRQTTQGLIGVAVEENKGVLVEVNCETDFVSRNQEFHSVVQDTLNACLSYLKKQSVQGKLTKICLDSEQLKNLKLDDGKSLADRLALMIGTVGENASLKRAMCIKTAPEIRLAGYAHPSSNDDKTCQLGRLGGILVYKAIEENENTNAISRGICQHIVGMDPKKIGMSTDEPVANKDDEICLIHQEYLLDESMTVKEILEENKLEVIDFKRFECGECSKAARDQLLEYVETCQ